MSLHRCIRDVGTLAAVAVHSVLEVAFPSPAIRETEARARAAEDALNEYEAENDGIEPRAQCKQCGNVDTEGHQDECKRIPRIPLDADSIFLCLSRRPDGPAYLCTRPAGHERVHGWVDGADYWPLSAESSPACGQCGENSPAGERDSSPRVPPAGRQTRESFATQEALAAFDYFILWHVDPSLHAHFADDDDNDAERVRRAIIRAVTEGPHR